MLGEGHNKQICRLLNAREQEGMKLLFDMYYVPLVAWADTFLHDRSLAEDLVQEYFIHIWDERLYKKFRPESLSSYLRLVVRNRSINRVGKRDVLFRFMELERIEAIWEEYNDQRDLIISRVFDEIALLPPRCREVLDCIFIKGMTYRDTADCMKITLSTVKSLLTNAMSKLRERLDGKSIAIFFHYFFTLDIKRSVSTITRV